MNNWNELYKEKNEIQKKPSEDLNKAIKFFKENNIKTILDLGCGTGRNIPPLSKSGFEVCGCDISENALNICKKKLPNVNFEQCNMNSLPYKTESFDGILCYQVIQHAKLDDIKKAISEIYRVLKKEGILFLKVISVKHSKYLTGEEIEPNTKINTDAIDGEILHHFFTEQEMNECFKDFNIIKLEHSEYRSEIEPNKLSASWELYAKK